MKLLLPALLLTMISFSGKAAVTSCNNYGNSDTTGYMKQAIAFLQEIRQADLADSNFVLKDSSASLIASMCMDQLLKDTARFTKKELRKLASDNKSIKIKWQDKWFKKIRIVSSDSISTVFKDTSKGWSYFNKHIASHFNSFGAPLFLRGGTYCIFYSSHSCGWLCGQGRLELYQKKDGKWIAVDSYCSWIS